MTVIENLRCVAAWLKLAADKLEAGDEAGARDCAKMAMLGIESRQLTDWRELKQA